MMRYFYDLPDTYTSMYGQVYICNHIVYSRCTLFKIGDDGLAVIQQKYDAVNKVTWWGEIDAYLNDVLYLHKNFREYFELKSGKADVDGLYPTVTIRQMMWAMRMKPLHKEKWETVFDRADI